MKHRNKLIEKKRHFSAKLTGLSNRYKDIAYRLQEDIHVSQLMGDIHLGQRANKIAIAITNSTQENENTQKS